MMIQEAEFEVTSDVFIYLYAFISLRKKKIWDPSLVASRFCACVIFIGNPKSAQWAAGTHARVWKKKVHKMV